MAPAAAAALQLVAAAATVASLGCDDKSEDGRVCRPHLATCSEASLLVVSYYCTENEQTRPVFEVIL